MPTKPPPFTDPTVQAATARAPGQPLLTPGLPRLPGSGIALLVLVGLLLAGLLAAVVWLSSLHEDSANQERLQQQTDAAVGQLRARLSDAEVELQLFSQTLTLPMPADPGFEQQARRILDSEPAMLRIERRDGRGRLLAWVDAGPPRPVLASGPRRLPSFETGVALTTALDYNRSFYSRSYYEPLTPDGGFDIFELVVPSEQRSDGARPAGALLAVYSAPRMLATMLPADFLTGQHVWATEADSTFVARANDSARGRAIYKAASHLDLPGVSLVVHANSRQGSPKLIPNLLTGWLVMLTLALAASGWLLWRHVRLRLRAERALLDQHVFRKAMEDSLLTGLRARDLDGRLTYVNPAFCRMTGFDAGELLGSSPPMPYWVPEQRAEHYRRYEQVLSGRANPHGYESVYQRKDGRRFTALIFEAPLVDEQGRHHGWMGSVLDISEQRRIEELNRRQQEKLQTNSRLSILGEVASALSHELNQPLAAIQTYAAACEALIGRDGPVQVSGALRSIRAQTERAGQVIRSVQAFVRRREVESRPLSLSGLLVELEPLIRLQTRRIGATCDVSVEPGLDVIGDPILLEQVLLNLTRNAVDAMEDSEPASRRLEIGVQRQSPGQVLVRVLDRGRGVDPAHRASLFGAFFTTKPDGMGMGLSLCRSVIERLGGRLDYHERPGGGSVFSFTLTDAASGPGTTP